MAEAKKKTDEQKAKDRRDAMVRDFIDWAVIGEDDPANKQMFSGLSANDMTAQLEAVVKRYPNADPLELLQAMMNVADEWRADAFIENFLSSTYDISTADALDYATTVGNARTLGQEVATPEEFSRIVGLPPKKQRAEQYPTDYVYDEKTDKLYSRRDEDPAHPGLLPEVDAEGNIIPDETVRSYLNEETGETATGAEIDQFGALPGIGTEEREGVVVTEPGFIGSFPEESLTVTKEDAMGRPIAWEKIEGYEVVPDVDMQEDKTGGFIARRPGPLSGEPGYGDRFAAVPWNTFAAYREGGTYTDAQGNVVHEGAPVPGPGGGEPGDYRRGYGAPPPSSEVPTVPPNVYVREPQYREFDQWGMFAGKSPEYIREVQEDLVAAGLMPKRGTSNHWGQWTTFEAQAMYGVLEEANGRGLDWETVLSQKRRNFKKLLDEGAPDYVKEPFVAPDYAYMSDAVKSTFEVMLGRAPKPYELQLLIGEMQGSYQEEYQQESALAKARADAQFQAELTESPTRVKGSYTDVDPNARMAEAIRTHFGPEMEMDISRAETQENSGRLLSSVLGLDAMIGGM